jgi:hypothetical protein
MLGSKLKDWDKAQVKRLALPRVSATQVTLEVTNDLFMVQDPDVAKQTEVPLDNFSDDE